MKSNEWYTPAKYIEAAREVMGSIDLDPASCALANETVKAARYYTVDDDGLQQSWSIDGKQSRVWCNPPYNAQPGEPHPQPLWSRKLVSEYRRGSVEQAVLLVSASVKQNWFHELMEFVVCFALQRICFDRPGNTPQELRHGNAFVYLGPNEDRFISTFSQFGTVARRVSPTS